MATARNISVGWWSQHHLKISQQLAMPWYDSKALIQPPSPNPEGLSPELLPLRQEIIEAAQTVAVAQLIQDYQPATEIDLIFMLKASGSQWNKITFPTGAEPIYAISGERGTREVIEIGRFDEVKSAEQWVNDVEPSDYLNIQEENFWEGVPDSGYVLYHGTYEERLPSIKKRGLKPDCETRGMSNRNAPCGVFTSTEFETAASSYEIVIEIDVSAMKRNKYLPEVAGEEPVQEDQQRRALADFIGMYEYIGDENIYNSDGLREDTVVFYGWIPPKYLKVVTSR